MEKVQLKPRKDKRHNTETGLLLGHNSNVFSQLSASYLQNKPHVTEDEQTFLQATKVIEYHDTNVNRLIALLRKKAEVTKFKAAAELKEEIAKMDAESVQEFMPTFAHLFSEIAVNELSKQVIDEFITILTHLLSAHKKIVIQQIATLYPAMLLYFRLSKSAELLFQGNEQEQLEKGLKLLLKHDTRKKFMIVFKIIMSCEPTEKVIQSNFQRNCVAIMKVLKEFIRVFERSTVKDQDLAESFVDFLERSDEHLSGHCIDEYFKIGGRAKASILELYSALIRLKFQQPALQIEWQHHTKSITANFLDKDPAVQQSLWHYCNKSVLNSLLAMAKAKQEGQDQAMIALLNQFFPKCDEKLLAGLKVGGIALYKELSSYVGAFPYTRFTPQQTHKSLVNKLSFVRKLMSCLLEQEDQNQARTLCYEQLTTYFIRQIRVIKITDFDEKKQKQLSSLISKTQRQLMEQLQQKYYSNPPISRNSPTYFIPTHFANLIHSLDPTFEFSFHPELTFALYSGLKPLPSTQKYLDSIFNHSKSNQQLLFRYLQTFPPRQLEIDMSEHNGDTQIAPRIFLLTAGLPGHCAWFDPSWDLKKQLIVFDPRITVSDFQVDHELEENHVSLYFRPVNNNLSSHQTRPEHDHLRYAFFERCLTNPERIHQMKFLIPLTSELLIPRNPLLLNKLLRIYCGKAVQLQTNTWVVGAHQVVSIRIICEIVIDCLLRHTLQALLESVELPLLEEFFASFGEFARAIHFYKLDYQFQQLLKKSNQLLARPEYRQKLFETTRKSIKKSYIALMQGDQSAITYKVDKIRRNRLHKCTDFIERIIWYCVDRNETGTYLSVFKDLIAVKDGWSHAAHRYQPWVIGYALLASAGKTDSIDQEIAKEILGNPTIYLNIIGMILSCQMILSLQSHSEIKARFTQLQLCMINHISVTAPQQQLSIIEQVIGYALQNTSYQISQGIQHLIKSLFKSYETLSPQLLHCYGQTCIAIPYSQLKSQGPAGITNCFILINIFTALPLKDIPQIKEICQHIFGEILGTAYTEDPIKFLQIIALLSVFWDRSIGLSLLQLPQTLQPASTLQPARTFLVKTVEYFKILSTNNDIMSSNFSTYCLFSLVNSLSPHKHDLFKSEQPQLLSIFYQTLQPGTPFHCIIQSSKLKFASRLIMTAPLHIQTELIAHVSNLACQEYTFYKDLLMQMELDEEAESANVLPHHENIANLFIQISEFLVRVTGLVSQQIAPDQSILLKLLECPFEGLKKSSVMLLKRMYALKIVSQNPPKIYDDLFRFEVQQDDQLTPQFAGHLSTYFYTWQVLLLRRQATDRNETHDENSFSLQQYVSSRHHAEQFLRNVFRILEDKLQFTNNEQQFRIDPEELLLADSDVAEFEHDKDLMKKVYKITMRTFFVFTINFPLFLRDFMDGNKKYKVLCDRLLRIVISQAIFKQQVSKIQLKQSQWKANGNLEIYVTPKSKEIYAEYTHEAIRIGLHLIMRGNYPLAPIAIEFKEGLKMEEGSRLALMLQTQLHHRNNTIIDGILLWKQNIEKKLAGVEECAICMDIVNHHGQLPKKSCKTCRKKFHGNCILKWFTTSNKSECPMCKSQFL